jgi:excisionase family DNA binding protein
VAERILERIDVVDATVDGWMTSAQAADYLGLTRHALDKLCAATDVPFAQDTAGGKRWFKRPELDAWRWGTSGLLKRP